MADQDLKLDVCIKLSENVRDRFSVTMNSITELLDCTILMHMVQQNITNDLAKVNLLAHKTEHELIT